MVPQVNDSQIPSSSTRRCINRSSNLLRPVVFQNLVTINPKNELRVQRGDSFEDKILVPRFIQALEWRPDHSHSITERLADGHSVIRRMIIEHQNVTAKPQCTR